MPVFVDSPTEKRQVKTDFVLGGGAWSSIVYLDRSKVIDFGRLGQDIMMFRGRIH